MRQKKLYTIIAFETTYQAIKSEKTLKGSGVEGRLIPLPPEIDAGCGLAYRCSVAMKDNAERILNQNRCEFKACTTMLLF